MDELLFLYAIDISTIHKNNIYEPLKMIKKYLTTTGSDLPDEPGITTYALQILCSDTLNFNDIPAVADFLRKKKIPNSGKSGKYLIKIPDFPVKVNENKERVSVTRRPLNPDEIEEFRNETRNIKKVSIDYTF